MQFLDKYFNDMPELKDEVPTALLSHKELYEVSIRKATAVYKKLREMQQKSKNPKVDGESYL